MAPAAGTGLLSRDRGLVFHPYAPLTGTEPLAVRGAEGVRLDLVTVEGQVFDVVDAMSSWWAVVHGYRHPVLDAAIARQQDEVSHVMFGGLTHEPAVALAEELVRLAGGPMPDAAHVFLADSGSVAVEVALKLAVQYQGSVGRPGRQRFLALRGGYHGDTLGAMSVCDPVGGMHAAFDGILPRHLFLPRPPAARLGDDGVLHSVPAEVAEWTAALERLLTAHGHELAAIIAEPVLQGAGGMHVYAPECLRALRAAADEHGLLLILDEIATGFGRTGRLFASEWAGVAPDVLCVGKALTGGYLTLGAVVISTGVGAAIDAGEHRAILHGPTFMGNPLACAVALASLRLIDQGWAQRVPALRAGLAGVRDVRVLGAVGVVEMDRAVDVPAVTRAALRRGVWVRPFRDLVYTMPPFVCTAQDVTTIGAGIVGAVAQVHGR